MAEQIKLAVLEEKLQNFETLVSRLDSAIEKIAEVNNNVSRMLAVHEERITKQEEIDAVLFDKICLLYTSPSPRDQRGSRMPSSA